MTIGKLPRCARWLTAFLVAAEKLRCVCHCAPHIEYKLERARALPRSQPRGKASRFSKWLSPDSRWACYRHTLPVGSASAAALSNLAELNLFPPAAALGADHARAEPRHLGLSRMARHIDQPRVRQASFRHDAIKFCTPSSRMLPSVIAGPAVAWGSFDYLVGAGEERRRNVEAKRLGRRMFSTSSNFVGCSTGRSAGLAPCKILCTWLAARR